MDSNLWIYSTHHEQQYTAASLILCGSEVFKQAKIVKDISLLKQLSNESDQRAANGPVAPLQKLWTLAFLTF